MLSLISASLGMFAKQFMAAYLEGHFTSYPEYLRVREFRWENMNRWHIFAMDGWVTALLQAALLLFFTGLVDFLRHHNPVVGWIVTGLTIAWLTYLCYNLLASIVSSRYPHLFFSPTGIVSDVRRTIHRWLHLTHHEEKDVRTSRKYDIMAFIGIDDVLRDDVFVNQNTRPCLKTVKLDDVVKFVEAVLQQRLHEPRRKSLHKLSHPWLFPRLTNMALSAILGIAMDAIEAEIKGKTQALPESKWMSQALLFVFEAMDYVYTENIAVEPEVHGQFAIVQWRMATYNDWYLYSLYNCLSWYPSLKWRVPDLKEKDVSRMFNGARQLAKKHMHPMRLCKVVLDMATYVMRQRDGRYDGPSILKACTGDWIRLVEMLVERIEAVNEECPECRDACMDLCHDLNESMAHFVSSDLERALEKPRPLYYRTHFRKETEFP